MPQPYCSHLKPGSGPSMELRAGIDRVPQRLAWVKLSQTMWV